MASTSAAREFFSLSLILFNKIDTFTVWTKSSNAGQILMVGTLPQGWVSNRSIRTTEFGRLSYQQLISSSQVLSPINLFPNDPVWNVMDVLLCLEFTSELATLRTSTGRFDFPVANFQMI